MAHPCERVSMHPYAEGLPRVGKPFRGAEEWMDGGRERREIGWFTLEGSPCSFCKFLSCLIPWRDSGAYRLGATFLKVKLNRCGEELLCDVSPFAPAAELQVVREQPKS